MEGGGKWVWRWGKRGIIHLSLHCHHQNDSCIKVGSDESHFNVSLIVRDKVTRPCPQTATFWRERRAEAASNRGPSAYQPNALPLGSLVVWRGLLRFISTLPPAWRHSEVTCLFQVVVVVVAVVVVRHPDVRTTTPTAGTGPPPESAPTARPTWTLTASKAVGRVVGVGVVVVLFTHTAHSILSLSLIIA